MDRDPVPENCRFDNVNSQSMAVWIRFEKLDAKCSRTGTDVDCIDLVIIESLPFRRTGMSCCNGARGRGLSC